MQRRRLQKILYRMMGLALAFSLAFQSYASSETLDKIEDQQEEIDATQQEIQEAEEQQKKLEEAKSNMESYLKDLNNQYATIGEEIAALEDQVADKEKEIETTQAELEKAKQIEEKQYEDMKTRIQYMYENPQDSLISMLIEADSFADALNRASYVLNLSEYDKGMMESYAANKAAIAEKEAELQGEKEALDELYADVTAKQAKVSALASSTGSKISAYMSDIADAEAAIDGKEGTLAGQKATLDKLITQYKAEEAAIEAAKAAEIENSLGDIEGVQTGDLENATYGAYSASEEEIKNLAVIIYCEAANQGDAGRLAVGAVVMNRIRDPRFSQKDIISVIRASGQFSPVTSGRFDLILNQSLDSVTEECWNAARRAIAGECNVGNRVFFRTWANMPSLSGLVIGAHIFSYTWNYSSN